MSDAAKNIEAEGTDSETPDPVEALFVSMDVAGQAINRLETFVFSATKLMVDNKIISFDDLALYMDALQSFETLDKFWVAEPGDLKRKGEESSPADDTGSD